MFLILESADRIDPSTVKAVNANSTSPGSIKIFWKEPEVSNGPIVSYQLEYKKVGDHVILIYIYIIINVLTLKQNINILIYF